MQQLATPRYAIPQHSAPVEVEKRPDTLLVFFSKGDDMYPGEQPDCSPTHPHFYACWKVFCWPGLKAAPTEISLKISTFIFEIRKVTFLTWTVLVAHFQGSVELWPCVFQSLVSTFLHLSLQCWNFQSPKRRIPFMNSFDRHPFSRPVKDLNTNAALEKTSIYTTPSWIQNPLFF